MEGRRKHGRRRVLLVGVGPWSGAAPKRRLGAGRALHRLAGSHGGTEAAKATAPPPGVEMAACKDFCTALSIRLSKQRAWGTAGAAVCVSVLMGVGKAGHGCWRPKVKAPRRSHSSKAKARFCAVAAATASLRRLACTAASLGAGQFRRAEVPAHMHPQTQQHKTKRPLQIWTAPPALSAPPLKPAEAGQKPIHAPSQKQAPPILVQATRGATGPRDARGNGPSGQVR